MVSTATWDMKGGGKWQSIFCEWCETRRNDVILREFVCDGNWFVLISCLWFASSEMVQGPVKWHDDGICRGPYAGDVSGDRKPWRHVMDQNANDGPNNVKQWSSLSVCRSAGSGQMTASDQVPPFLSCSMSYWDHNDGLDESVLQLTIVLLTLESNCWYHV